MEFSVIIPARNEEEFIGDAIRSVVAQTVPRECVEIIVVSNASSDNTTARATAAGADLIVDEREVGTNTARQRGVDESRGSYLAFLDADCIAPPNWLETVRKHLAMGADVVSGPYNYGLPGLRGRAVDLCFRFGFQWVCPVLKVIVGYRTCPIVGGNFAVARELMIRMRRLPPLKFFGDDTAISIFAEYHGGKVVFANDLVVVSSPRRFIQDGYVCTSLRYLHRYFRLALHPRSNAEAFESTASELTVRSLDGA